MSWDDAKQAASIPLVNSDRKRLELVTGDYGHRLHDGELDAFQDMLDSLRGPLTVPQRDWLSKVEARLKIDGEVCSWSMVVASVAAANALSRVALSHRTIERQIDLAVARSLSAFCFRSVFRFSSRAAKASSFSRA